MTNATMYQDAKQVMRLHPELTMAEVGERCGIPELLRQRIIGEARRELVTAEGLAPFGE